MVSNVDFYFNFISFFSILLIFRGNEAIEIGLWHANQEKDLSQVVLVGDAPPNTREEVLSKRSNYHFWKNSRFPETYYINELETLKAKNIPVHAFYVAENAKTSFQEIATFTNGKSEKLDIASIKGSEILTNLVNIEILRNIGGAHQGNDLVKAYKTKFNAF